MTDKMTAQQALMKELRYWRAERPDEWKIDEIIRIAEKALSAPDVAEPVAWSLRFRHGDKYERVGPVNYMTTFGSKKDADIYANRVARDIYGNPAPERRPVVVPLYVAPPAVQQPVPDVSALVEALESAYHLIANHSGETLPTRYASDQMDMISAALAAHRNRGEAQ